MKNKLTDLNNHLFAQLERLTDEDLAGEKLAQEIKRSEAVTAIGETIIRNADLTLKAAKLVAESGGSISRFAPVVEQLTGPAKPVIEDKPQ